MYFVTAQMVGNRRSPGATILGGESGYPLPPTIALRSRRQVAYILIPCGQCTRWLVLYLQTGFDVAASLVLTVAAAAFLGLDVAASLMPAVAAAISEQ